MTPTQPTPIELAFTAALILAFLLGGVIVWLWHDRDFWRNQANGDSGINAIDFLEKHIEEKGKLLSKDQQ